MGRAVVFKTPGLIDLRSFTMFGVNAKPNSQNPIGYFGTGLKYAIACLVRSKIEVVVWIGSDQYTFYAKETKFRDKEFLGIQMKKVKHTLGDRLGVMMGKPSYSTLPYTTELGKTWELWQVFRELKTNTDDENGSTFMMSEGSVVGEPNTTYIVVYGELFAQEYLNRDRTFLPDGLREQGETTSGIQIIDRPSQYIYYRGMRVYDLPVNKPAQQTYNFLERIDLTEDRTAKYGILLEDKIASLVSKSNEPETIARVLRAPRGSYESGFNYSNLYYGGAPSTTFRDIARDTDNQSAKELVRSWEPKTPVKDPFEKSPRPWTITDGGMIHDANGALLRSDIMKQAIQFINKANLQEFIDAQSQEVQRGIDADI